MRPVVYGRVAAALFAAEMVFAIVHRAAGGEYSGFTHWHNVTIDIALAVIWGAAALAALVHRPKAAFAAVIAGSALSVIHGLMFTIAGSNVGLYGIGLPFVAVAIVQFYCAAHAMDAFVDIHIRRAVRRGGGDGEKTPGVSWEHARAH